MDKYWLGAAAGLGLVLIGLVAYVLWRGLPQKVEAHALIEVEVPAGTGAPDRDRMIATTIDVLQHRLYGMAEFRRLGATRLLIGVEGRPDMARLRRVLTERGSVAGFHLVDESISQDGISAHRVPIGETALPLLNPGDPKLVVFNRIVLSGSHIEDARQAFDSQGNPEVDVRLDSFGKARLARLTTDNPQTRMALVMGGLVITAPVIREPITGGEMAITGSFTERSAQDIAARLDFGLLPARLRVIEMGPGMPK